jgi:hypothetical protein
MALWAYGGGHSNVAIVAEVNVHVSLSTGIYANDSTFLNPLRGLLTPERAHAALRLWRTARHSREALDALQRRFRVNCTYGETEKQPTPT